jgi:hypothetical protein
MVTSYLEALPMQQEEQHPNYSDPNNLGEDLLYLKVV